MENFSEKHILIISNIEWSDENAFGNTISNWFKGMSGVRFSSIYCRNSLPNNQVCQRYYSIPPQSILLHFFHKEKIGRCFTKPIQNSSAKSEGISKERKFIQFLHRHNIDFRYVVENFLFHTKRWHNKRFRDFILEDKPDVVFSFLDGRVRESEMLKVVKQLAPSSKRVIFIADDVYGMAGKAAKKRIREVICSADATYGISPMLCSEYQKIFGVPIAHLVKGCHLTEKLQTKKSGDLLTILYAGNLHYGRDDTLALLAKEIVAVNRQSSKKIILKIFSTSELKEKYSSVLNDRENVFFEGGKSNQYIQKELLSADFALHAESFDPEWQKVVRYSFSTKITDCMESGSVLLAIGPSTIASIDIVKNIPGTVVIDSPELLSETLKNLCSLDLDANREALHEYALAYYDVKKIQDKFYRDLLKLSSSSN